MPASDTMYSDWLAQANFIQTQWKFRDNVQFPFLVDGGRFMMTISPTFTPASSLHQFSELEDTPVPDKVYYFVPDPQVDTQGFCHFPQSYWADDPEGHRPLSASMISFLCLQRPAIKYYPRGYYWKQNQYEALCSIHGACGFDPYSSDIAHYLGVTLFKPPIPEDQSSQEFENSNSLLIDGLEWQEGVDWVANWIFI